MTKQQKDQLSKSSHDQQRMEFCRMCICEFQRLGYQDAYLAELKSDKDALLDKYQTSHFKPSD